MEDNTQPHNEPAAAPPAPGTVVTGNSNAQTPPVQAQPTQPEPQPSAAPQEPSASQPPVPNHPQARPQPAPQPGGGGKRSWFSWLLFIIVIAALAAGGWYYYQHKKTASNNGASTGQSQDIPLLRIGLVGAGYGQLYPNMGVNEYGYLTNSQMFEGLVRYENKSKIVPDLASNWTNPDSKTWIFTVKSGIKFHDGHTLTAQDVKYSLDSMIASKSDLAQTFANTIATVDLVGANKVKITTTQPDPTLLNRLAFLYIIDSKLPKGDEPSQAGTGPYEIKPGTKPSDTSLQMVAFDQYHGGRPTTRALAFGNNNDPAALVKAFRQHQYDIVQVSDPALVSGSNKISGSTQFTSTEADTKFIGFNTVKPGPLQNKLVREAIRYAVSPVAIGASGGAQLAPRSQMIPESIPGYNPSITPYKQDISKAKQLLAQAGYPNGLTLSLSAVPPLDEAKEITKELKQVGITVTTDSHTDFNEFIDYFSNGKAEMYIVDYSSDTLDGLDIYTTTLPTANYNNPKFTDLLNQAGNTTDPAKRLKILQDAGVIVDQDIPAVPLGGANDLWQMNKNYALQQDMPSSYISVYFYKVHQ